MIVEDMVRFIDLSTGLENRNALIETCKHYKNEQDSERKLSLALFDTNEMFNVQTTKKMKQPKFMKYNDENDDKNDDGDGRNYHENLVIVYP